MPIFDDSKNIIAVLEIVLFDSNLEKKVEYILVN